MSSWTAIKPTGSKKRTGFGPHPESEHPGQMRLECRSRTAISCDSHERREQHFRRPAEKLVQHLFRLQKQRTRASPGRIDNHTTRFKSMAAQNPGRIKNARNKKRNSSGTHA